MKKNEPMSGRVRAGAEVQLITVEDIKAHAEVLLEQCKESLQKDGGLWRRAYLYAPGEEGTTVAILDLAPSTEGLLEMLAVTDPRFATLLPVLKENAEKMGVTDFARTTAKVLTRGGLDEGEITARFLAHMVKQLHAYAVVHVSDARFLALPPEEMDKPRPRYLKDDPRSREALLVSVETRRYQAVTVVEYDRDGTGRVTGFKDPRTNVGGEGGEMHGRIFGLLQDIPLN